MLVVSLVGFPIISTLDAPSVHADSAPEEYLPDHRQAVVLTALCVPVSLRPHQVASPVHAYTCAQP